MKSLPKLLAFVVVVWLAWLWLSERRRHDFKYNLPPLPAPATTAVVATTAALPEAPLPKIPLAASGRFEINETYRPQLQALYAYIFDSLKLAELTPAQLSSSALADLDGGTIVQLIAYAWQQPRANEHTRLLGLAGLLLKNEQETRWLVTDYLMREERWLATAVWMHRILMEQPDSPALHRAYAALLRPATTRQTLDYLKAVQYLERGPRDEYYQVNPALLERFDTATLQLLLDKVDDYPWYAAYPERDAQQGIRKILRARP